MDREHSASIIGVSARIIGVSAGIVGVAQADNYMRLRTQYRAVHVYMCICFKADITRVYLRRTRAHPRATRAFPFVCDEEALLLSLKAEQKLLQVWVASSII